MSEVEHSWTNRAKAPPKRDLRTAMGRGLRGRCPRCGEGKLFRAFLKIDDACSVCGQEFITTALTICRPTSSS